MNYGEMSETLENLINEYFRARGWFDDQREDYRKRLKTFFADNVIPDDLRKKFRESGVGESYYMTHGHQILS